MVYSDIVSAVMNMAQNWTDVQITAGALPVNEGLTMTPAVSAPMETYRDRSDNYHIDLVFNGKSLCQQFIMDEMMKVHEKLTRAYNYPSSDEWQVYAIESSAAPTYLGREDSGYWLYGSSLNVKFYWRNKNA